jgi:hypothetical protein
MAKQTIQAQLQRALEARGWKVAEHTTSRYVVMTHPNFIDRVSGKPGKIFLGHNGSLRVGLTVTGSRSKTGGKFYKSLLAEAPTAGLESL